MTTAQEKLDFVRVLYAELSGELDHTLEGYESYLCWQSSLSITDCKSLSDALTSTGGAVSHTGIDPRLAIEIAMIKQRMEARETRFQWIDNSTMIADVLTKGIVRGDVKLLQRLLDSAVYTIKGSAELLEKKKQNRERIAAMKAARTETVTNTQAAAAAAACITEEG